MSPRPTDYDVLILGGGPAGSTTGALLKKYHPRLRVGLIEEAPFPRYHIGESLIIEANRILQDMGALDAVAGGGFVRKGGATFVWGEDREPWSLLFADARRLRPDPSGVFEHTFHVERQRFDTLLLEVARGHGVEVMQPLAVEEVLFGDQARARGVRTARGTLTARTLVDASGRAGVLARHVGKRIYDPLLRNVAVYGYWRGARLDARYSGSFELSRIVVVSIPQGWIWYIPVAPNLLSVGVVTSAETFRGRGELEDFYRRQLASSPEVAAWLDGAALEGPVRVESDFNYCHDRLAGPGFLLVGDAAGFVDPLFSIGVFLAQSAAQLAAYFLGAAFDGTVDEARLSSAFEHHVRGQYEAFRAMAYVFYGFNSTKEEWWRATRALLRSQALPDDVEDREAFMAMTFGFGVNLSVFREAISCFGQLAGPQLREILLGQKAVAEPRLRDYARRPPLPLEARPRLAVAYTVTPSVIPVEGTGRVLPMSRIELADSSGREAKFPRALYVPDEVAALLPRLDGATTVAALGDTPGVRHLLRALDGMGALA